MSYKTDVCKTETCWNESISFKSIIDNAIDPCEDFYQFSCGKFLNDTETLESGRKSFSTTSNRKKGIVISEFPIMSANNVILQKCYIYISKSYFSLYQIFLKIIFSKT